MAITPFYHPLHVANGKKRFCQITNVPLGSCQDAVILCMSLSIVS
jgi:hypothetical protein